MSAFDSVMVLLVTAIPCLSRMPMSCNPTSDPHRRSCIHPKQDIDVESNLDQRNDAVQRNCRFLR
jgi:hypothetical protein